MAFTQLVQILYYCAHVPVSNGLCHALLNLSTDTNANRR